MKLLEIRIRIWLYSQNLSIAVSCPEGFEFAVVFPVGIDEDQAIERLAIDSNRPFGRTTDELRSFPTLCLDKDMSATCEDEAQRASSSLVVRTSAAERKTSKRTCTRPKSINFHIHPLKHGYK